MTETEHCTECDTDVLPTGYREGEFRCPSCGWQDGLSAGIYERPDGKRFWQSPHDDRVRDLSDQLKSVDVSIERVCEPYKPFYEYGRKPDASRWTPEKMQLRIETLKKQLERIQEKNDRYYK